MPLWRDTKGVVKRLIGLEAFLDPSLTIPLKDRPIAVRDDGDKLEGDAWYIIRNAANSYELVHIPELGITTPMVAVRTAAASPFADECTGENKNRACAIYFGGFDFNGSKHMTLCKASPCAFPPSNPTVIHNTAWIVKGSGAE